MGKNVTALLQTEKETRFGRIINIAGENIKFDNEGISSVENIDEDKLGEILVLSPDIKVNDKKYLKPNTKSAEDTNHGGDTDNQGGGDTTGDQGGDGGNTDDDLTKEGLVLLKKPELVAILEEIFDGEIPDSWTKDVLSDKILELTKAAE